MGIKNFSINFDSDEVHYAGQTVSGRVCFSVDRSIELRGVVELSLYGKAQCKLWKCSCGASPIDGLPLMLPRPYYGTETFFQKSLILAGDGQEFELPAGDYEYPFSVTIPASSPPTFKGKYGEIRYGGKVKLNLVRAFDKVVKKPFVVESPIDLNMMSKLNQPYQDEKSKTFCCWCCRSAPLTVTVSLPRTGFVPNETIPISIDVENASNVGVHSVKIELMQIIYWNTNISTSKQKILIKRQELIGGVDANASKTWAEAFHVEPGEYTHSGNCQVIEIGYNLQIKLDVEGLHRSLVMSTPITIGDIPFKSSN